MAGKLVAETHNQLDNYFLDAPSPQSILDIFPDDWMSMMPASTGLTTRTGRVPLFEDSRITWGLGLAGGLAGAKVLELGPLEGGHTYMMLQDGAASVRAIEANARAFMRCLCTKEALEMDNARFMLGDFCKYMEQTDERYDFILACGVLYHMINPVRMIELVAEHSNKALIWTQYFDSDDLTRTGIRDRFAKQSEQLAGKYGSYEVYRHNYGEALDLNSYCGGIEEHSAWMTRESLFKALSDVGFDRIESNHETRDHPHGPCLTIYAERTS